VTDKKKKVLLVAFEQIPSPRGLSCWLTEEIKLLAGRYNLDVLSLKSEDLSHIERLHGARLLRVPVGEGAFLERIKTFQRAIRRQLDSEDYAVCHFLSIWGGLVLAARKAEATFKLLYEVHSLPSIDFKVLHPGEAPLVEHSFPLKQQEEHCLAAADQVIAGSELIRRHLIGRGVPAESVTLVRPSLDLDPFDKLGEVPRQPGTILYLGSLAPWQGVPSLLKAVAELPHGLPLRLHLVCPGDDPFRKEVLGKIQMLGLARRAELIDTPPVEQIPGLVARADVCVAPFSNHVHNRLAASTPHKLMVYMACRRPIVASRQTTVTEIVEDGVQAVLYPPGDAHALSTAIKKLLLDRDLGTRLGNQARLRLEELATPKRARQALSGVYRRLVGGVFEAAHDTDKLEMPAASETDTQPRISEGGESGQQAPEVTEDTVTLQLRDGQPLTDPASQSAVEPPPPPTSDTDPNGQQLPTQDDLVFKSVDDEDTAPRRNPDGWQVMELSGVDLPFEDDREAGEDRKKGRWLLGGPPFPVGPDTEGLEDEKHQELTRRADAATPENLQMLPDSDVRLIESNLKNGSAREPPTDPRRKK